MRCPADHARYEWSCAQVQLQLSHPVLCNVRRPEMANRQHTLTWSRLTSSFAHSETGSWHWVQGWWALRTRWNRKLTLSARLMSSSHTLKQEADTECKADELFAHAETGSWHWVQGWWALRTRWNRKLTLSARLMSSSHTLKQEADTECKADELFAHAETGSWHWVQGWWALRTRWNRKLTLSARLMSSSHTLKQEADTECKADELFAHAETGSWHEVLLLIRLFWQPTPRQPRTEGSHINWVTNNLQAKDPFTVHVRCLLDKGWAYWSWMSPEGKHLKN